MSVDLFVLGCSHAGRLIKGAELIGLDAAGGALMRGRLWDEGRFGWSDADGLALHDTLAEARLKAALEAAGVRRLEDLEAPIVTTLGFQYDIILDELAKRHTLAHDLSDPRDFLTRDAFAAYVLERRAKLLGLIGWLASRGVQIVVVAPPPRHWATDFARAFEEVVGPEISAQGARFLPVRDWAADAAGRLRPKFEAGKEDDQVHGNTYFGATAMDKVASLLGLTPPIDRAVLADGAAFDAYALSLRRTASSSFAEAD